MSGQSRKSGTRRNKGNGHHRGKVFWNGEEVLAVRRNFCVEHPDVARRSEHESERIRIKYSIYAYHWNHESIPKPVESFYELPFPDWIMKELERQNFEEMMPIQVQAWPAAIQGHDMVGIAETGSGKTLAYVLPMLVHAHAQLELRLGEGPIGLVLVPTRNLCIQVVEACKLFARHISGNGLTCMSCYDLTEQSSDLESRCDVMVATPGRLRDYLNKNVTNLKRATFVVLDEADELLKHDFEDQVRAILRSLRDDRQILLFSATWPAAVEELAEGVLSHSPLTIITGSTKLSACKNITQSFQLVLDKISSQEEKMTLFLRKIDTLKNELGPDFKVLVFVNKKETVPLVVKAIREHCGVADAEGYGGFVSNEQQIDRDLVLERFGSSQSTCHLLVATHVLGRGLDVRTIRLVINFDMPMKLVEYVHRIGRTGRAGETGKSWTLLQDSDLACARDLRECLRASEQQVPTFILNACKEWKHYLALNRQRILKQQETKNATEKRELPDECKEHPKETQDKRAQRLLEEDLRSGGNKPFYSLRNDLLYGPRWLCVLCNKYVVSGHNEGEKHVRREKWYWEHNKERTLLPQQAVTRHYSDEYQMYYWHDSKSNVSKWELQT